MSIGALMWGPRWAITDSNRLSGGTHLLTCLRSCIMYIGFVTSPMGIDWLSSVHTTPDSGRAVSPDRPRCLTRQAALSRQTAGALSHQTAAALFRDNRTHGSPPRPSCCMIILLIDNLHTRWYADGATDFIWLLLVWSSECLIGCLRSLSLAVVYCTISFFCCEVGEICAVGHSVRSVTGAELL